MWEDIVLGIIPGTQIQVSFEIWAITMAILVVAVAGGYNARTIRRMTLLLRIRSILHTGPNVNMLLTRSLIS